MSGIRGQRSKGEGKITSKLNVESLPADGGAQGDQGSNVKVRCQVSGIRDQVFLFEIRVCKSALWLRIIKNLM